MNRNLAKMGLDFTMLLIEAVFEDEKWMVDLQIHPSAERTLLQLREERSVQNCPVRVASQWVKLFEGVFASQLICVQRVCSLPCKTDQLLEDRVGLLAAFQEWIRVREGSHHLVVEILVEPVEVLLDEIEAAAA